MGRGGGGGRPGEVMGAARRLGSRGRGGPGCVGEGGLGGNPSKNAGPLRGLPPGPVLLFCPSNSCLIVRGTIWPWSLTTPMNEKLLNFHRDSNFIEKIITESFLF